MSYAASSRVAEVSSEANTSQTASEAREAERAASEAAKASFADANSRLKSILSTSAHWATFTSL
jgi:lysozyme family protein